MGGSIQSYPSKACCDVPVEQSETAKAVNCEIQANLCQGEAFSLGFIWQLQIIRVIKGLYRDNGKENGNYYIIIGYKLGFHMGGCQNYGPFLDPCSNTPPNI